MGATTASKQRRWWGRVRAKGRARGPATFARVAIVVVTLGGGLIGGMVGGTIAGCQQSRAARQEAQQTMTPSAGAAASNVAAELQRIRQARVLFSHHSVGGNILAGLARLYAQEGGQPFQTIPVEQAASRPGPLWVDAQGGDNKDPLGKIDAFAAMIRSGLGQPPQVAFMKFCYVDFNPSTDVDALFAHYQRTLAALKHEHPEITFAHVTVPLVRRPTEAKWRLFRLVGRPVWEDNANAKRNLFNDRLRQTFAAEPLFDLARAESTRPNGDRETFDHAGAVTYGLAPDYTDDGGHLNQVGQQVMATELVHFLARTLAKSL